MRSPFRSVIRLLFLSLFLSACGLCPAQLTQVFGYLQPWRYNTSAQDLGTAWRAPGFDDTAWAQGFGVFATAAEPLIQGATIGTVLRTTNSSGTFITNFYFRTTFVVTGAPISLIASNLIDDGAVIYLNGTEIQRFYMPTGSVTANTLALTVNDVSTRPADVFTIPGSALLPGTNALAVELHQSQATSSDMVWGMKLMAEWPVVVVITQQPQSQLAALGTMASFTVKAGPPPLRYQWRKDGTAIGNATNATFTIPTVDWTNAGIYSVIVSNGPSFAVSSNAELMVADNIPVSILNQPQGGTTPIGGTISLNATVSGSPPYFWHWHKVGDVLIGSTNSSLTITNAQPENAGFYFVVASNHLGSVTSSVVTVRIGFPDTFLVPLTNQWRYHLADTDVGTTWRDANFDDSGWPAGPGALGAEDSAAILQLIKTRLPLTNAAGNLVTTYYFRTRFTLGFMPEVATLITSNLIDDGAVFYINGIEYSRMTMPSGVITYSTLATGTTTEGVFVTNTIPANMLVQGENTLAVEVHQVNTTSSDLVFGMAVIQKVTPYGPLDVSATGPANPVFEGDVVNLAANVSGLPPWNLQWLRNGSPIPNATNKTLTLAAARVSDIGSYTVTGGQGSYAVTSNPVLLSMIAARSPGYDLVTFTQSWRYAEVESEIGNSWLSPLFDDAAWKEGRGIFVGHVQNPSMFPEPTNTVLRIRTQSADSIPAHYFRAHVAFSAFLSNAVIMTSNLLDDGAVFYLNGTEVARVRMPAGTIAYNTYASPNPTEGRVYERMEVKWPFVPGDNLLGVSIHQPQLLSSDNAFGTRLTAFALTTEPLALLASPPNVTVNEHVPVEFRAEIYGGGPANYQWYHNGAAIPGETNRLLSISSAHGSYAGSYSFTATNLVNGLASAAGSLTILHEETPPQILWVAQTNTAGAVWIRFSEPVDAAAATNASHYELEGAEIVGIRMVDAVTVELSIKPGTLPGTLTLTAANIPDLAVPPNVMAAAHVAVTGHSYRTSAGLLNIKTFFIVSFENHKWSEILGNPDCPYINNVLLPQASFASQHFQLSSLQRDEPNYIWMISGTNFNLWDSDQPSISRVRSTNHLPALLDQHGISWRTYQEEISGTDCPLFDSGVYVAKRNPFVYLDTVTSDPTYCMQHVRPMTELAADLAAGTTARYNFLTANGTNAMYLFVNGGPTREANGDRWLSQIMPQILNSSAYSNNGCVIITWDEYNDLNEIPPVGLLALSPLAKGNGYSNAVRYDHTSILRTVQEAFGVYPLLGRAAEVPSFSDLFRDVGITPMVTNGVAGVRVEGLATQSIAYAQASSDLANWTTIGTNMTGAAEFYPDPNTAGSTQRFYRVIGLK